MTILEERRKKIKEYIPDDTLRHIIFNYDDEDDIFLTDDKLCLHYFSNMMTFSMLTIWNLFLTWKKTVDSKLIDGDNSFWRIYNMLDKACDPTKINGEFVDDLLSNFEIDCLIVAPETNTTCFVEALGIIDFFHFSIYNKLSKYIYMVKQSRLHTRDVGVDFGFDAMCECLETFRFLRDVKLDLKPLNIRINNELRDDVMGITARLDMCSRIIKTVDYSYTFFTVPQWSSYFIEDFQPTDARIFDEKLQKNQLVTINYVQLGGSERIPVLLANESFDGIDAQNTIIGDAVVEKFFLDCDIINVHQSSLDETFFRDYILLNNKYLKNLAYTISDSLNSSLRQEVVAHYQPKYKEIFDKMYVYSLYNYKETAGYRWDEIVLFLLLEEGVYEFIRFLMSYSTYQSFKSSFIRRFGKDAINSVCEKEEFIANPECKLPLGASESAKIDCRAKAIVMLATHLLAQSNWGVENSLYPTTIDNIISECDRVYRTPAASKEKTVILCNLLLSTVSFVTKFYLGVFQYSRCKTEAIINLNSTGLYFNDYQKYKESKDQWIEVLKATIEKSSKKYSAKRITGGFEDVSEISARIRACFGNLISLNDTYSNYHDGNNEILFETTGKRSLFDSASMQRYCNSICGTIKGFNSATVYDLYVLLRDFFMYLKTGFVYKIREKRVKNGEHALSIESAIFPIVGQYFSGVTSVDGYKYSMFKILSASSEREPFESINIKMITDDEFDFGSSYYCVPNINRVANMNEKSSFDKIWVSPIIIPCSLYLPPSISRMEQLSEKDDFDRAIELIYGSDCNVYEKLFGSLQNAKQILPYLLNDPASKFYKKHYHFFRKKEKIIAIAALYDIEDFSWDINTDLMKKAFGNAGIELPESFDKAVTLLKNTFNNYHGKSFCYLDDVCVLEGERRRRIGSSMIMYLIKLAESQGKAVRLSVQSNNLIARQMYANLGFVATTKEVSEISNALEYIQMVRI